MKPNKLIKYTPFLLTLLILILLNITNKKEYTKLKILIWNTPSLSLGTYLSISSGTGFILSYIFTSNLAKYNHGKPKDEIQYKSEKQKEYDENNKESIREITYNNILIERNIKDPSPTINASFRVIGNTNIRKESLNTNTNYEYDNFEFQDESDYISSREERNNKSNNETYLSTNDWEDDAYINW